MKKVFKKIAIAASLGFALASSAQADVFKSFWFDADGAAGAGSAQLVYEFIDINTQFLGSNTNYVGNAYDFRQFGVAAISGINGGTLSDLTGATNTAFSDVRATYTGSGTGDLGNSTFSFSNGAIKFYNPAYTTLIAEFAIVSGGGSIVAGGVPNGVATLIAKAVSFATGYFFEDNAGVQGADFDTLSAAELDNLFGFSTTNASLISIPGQLAATDVKLSAAYADPIVQNQNGVNSVDAFGRPANFYVSANGQFRLNEVPEPASIALLGLGLVGLAASRRRRSAK